MSQLVRAEHFATARNINRQINESEHLNNLPVANSRPLYMGLDISNVCNVNCIFCLAHQNRKRASDPGAFRTPDLMDHFEPILPFVSHATLSSYEALLNPWLDQFIARLRRHYTPFQLFSNGKGLTPELSEFLLANGLTSLWCSFHGAERKTYDSIMKGSDYEQVLANLMHMKHFSRKHNLNFELTLVFCAMRRNIEELPRYMALAHRVGAKNIQINYLLVTKEGTGLEHEAMCFHPELYDSMVIEAKRLGARFGIRVGHQRLFSEGLKSDSGPCYQPWTHMNISQQGAVTVCCGGCGIMGNLFESGFQQVWNSKRLQEFRARVNSDNPPNECRNCSRGRENPWDIKNHITYLKGCSEEKRQSVIEELTRSAPPSVHAETLAHLAVAPTVPSNCCTTI
ncbi:radical SAM/SPASM domain-containing protein [Pseudodesulfovibrio sp.]|uniref:radical SAM/SPASM domain-containing protein n=1 Tax=unclassified Pseudodesulfovibrio TaxID=2661612 RepID=UPI003AFF9E2C